MTSARPAPEVLTFGEAMAMFVADTTGSLDEVEHYTRSLAGAETNVATGLARLGHSTGWIGRVGDDPFGRFIHTALSGTGIDTGHVTIDSDAPTGFQIKSHAGGGEPEVVYFRKNSAGSRLAWNPALESYIGSARHLHVTGIPLALSPTTRDFAFRAVKVAKEHGVTVSFDTNLRRWARFVSNPTYLTEHLASNVLGTVLVILGTVALGAYLTSTRAARLALTGMVVAVTGHILATVPAVLSTFATPAIGAAYLDGHPDVMAQQFPAALGPITALSLLLAVMGNLVLAVAIWRSGALPRWTGATWAAGTLTFYLLGAALGMSTTGASLPTQPVGGALLAISAAGIAWATVRRHAPHARTDESDNITLALT